MYRTQSNYELHRKKTTRGIDQIRSNENRTYQVKSDQIRPEQNRSQQLRSDQIRSDQIRSNQIKLHQIASLQNRSNHIRSDPGTVGTILEN